MGLDREPQTTGNHALTKRQEKAAIKKALNSGTFLLTGHDYPARIEHGRVVARLVEGSVPGPEIPVEHRFTSETHEPGHGARRVAAARRTDRVGTGSTMRRRRIRLGALISRPRRVG